MDNKLASELCLVLSLGVSAQWLGWRLNVPSILLLLIFGILAGPITGIVSPNALFGPLLLPLVSVLVSVILFEGGLSLRLSELRQVGRAFLGLATVGAAITFLLASMGAYKILSFPPPIALLFGAILVVTGPTVVLPLLRFARPAGSVASILRWEAIVLDPVGAILAILIYEAIDRPDSGSDAIACVIALGKAIFIGGGIGWIGASITLKGIKNSYIPQYLQNPVILAFVIAAFTAANNFQGESGLFAVTLFGAALANQSSLDITHILRFKETLSTLFLSVLFILLGARLTPQDVFGVTAVDLLFVAYLLFIVRPVSVFIGTLGSSLPLNERIYMACIAPRGIIAAAVCSVFALALKDSSYPSAAHLVPAMFIVILISVTFSGIVAKPLARMLNLIKERPQGLVFLGTESLTKKIASAINDAGFSVLLIERDWSRLSAARLEGFATYYGDVLSPQVSEDIDLGNYHRLCALTLNAELNALACVRFRKVFGKMNVFQLPFREGNRGKRAQVREQERGLYLFSKTASSDAIETNYGENPSVKLTNFTPEFDYAAFLSLYGSSVLPLFLIPTPGVIEPILAEADVSPTCGQGLIFLLADKESIR